MIADNRISQTKSITATAQGVRVEFALLPQKIQSQMQVSALMQQAKNYYDNEDYPNALRIINQALAIDSGNQVAINLKGQIVKMCDLNSVCGST